MLRAQNRFLKNVIKYARHRKLEDWSVVEMGSDSSFDKEYAKESFIVASTLDTKLERLGDDFEIENVLRTELNFDEVYCLKSTLDWYHNLLNDALDKVDTFIKEKEITQ